MRFWLQAVHMIHCAGGIVHKGGEEDEEEVVGKLLLVVEGEEITGGTLCLPAIAITRTSRTHSIRE